MATVTCFEAGKRIFEFRFFCPTFDISPNATVWLTHVFLIAFWATADVYGT